MTCIIPVGSLLSTINQRRFIRRTFAFRAVRVPAGLHRVVFAFEPVTWKIGLLISFVTLISLVGLWRRFTALPVNNRVALYDEE